MIKYFYDSSVNIYDISANTLIYKPAFNIDNIIISNKDLTLWNDVIMFIIIDVYNLNPASHDNNTHYIYTSICKLLNNKI